MEHPNVPDLAIDFTLPNNGSEVLLNRFAIETKKNKTPRAARSQGVLKRLSKKET